MAAEITKLPEWKYLVKRIHAKLPNHYPMLKFVGQNRFCFVAAKKTTLPVISTKKYFSGEYDPYHLSYAGVSGYMIAKQFPVLEAYFRGLDNAGMSTYTTLNFMTHPMLKDDTEFFKFIAKFIMTGHGHQNRYTMMKLIKDQFGSLNESNLVVWHCLDHDNGTLEEFKILNDMHDVEAA